MSGDQKEPGAGRDGTGPEEEDVGLETYLKNKAPTLNQFLGENGTTGGGSPADAEPALEIEWDDDPAPDPGADGATAAAEETAAGPAPGEPLDDIHQDPDVEGLESNSTAWILPEIEEEVEAVPPALAAVTPPDPDAPPKDIPESVDDIDFNGIELEYFEEDGAPSGEALVEELEHLLEEDADAAEGDLGPPLPDPSIPGADAGGPTPEPEQEPEPVEQPAPPADPAPSGALAPEDIARLLGDAAGEEHAEEEHVEEDLGPPLPDPSASDAAEDLEPAVGFGEANTEEPPLEIGFEEAGDLGPPLDDPSAPAGTAQEPPPAIEFEGPTAETDAEEPALEIEFDDADNLGPPLEDPSAPPDAAQEPEPVIGLDEPAAETEAEEAALEIAFEDSEDLGPPLEDPSVPADPAQKPEPAIEFDEPAAEADADAADKDIGFEETPTETGVSEASADADDMGPPLEDPSAPDADAAASSEQDADLGPPLADPSAPAEEVDAPPAEEAPPAPPPAAEAPARPAEMLAAAIEKHRQGDLKGAAEGYEKVARRDPGNPACWINLGIVLRRLGQLESAIVCLRRGIRIKPTDGAAWSNLGNALRADNQLEDAKRAQIKAISLNPGAPQIHYNLGLVLRDFGDLDEAAHAFHRAELLGYQNRDLPWDQSLNMMLGGDLKGGFETYDARFNLAEAVERYDTLPRWAGETAKDKTLLVHAEQGLGDSLQFCRYVPLLKDRAGQVVFDVQPPLVRLLEGNSAFDGVTLHARDGTMPDADLQIPLLSAPRYFPVDEEDLPGRGAYLFPPPEGLRLASGGIQKKVGLAWAGKPTHKNDRNRSIGLKAFSVLLDHPAFRFYGLQVGPERKQIDDLALGALVEDVTPHIRDFADTASLLMDLDLVVTVDTSLAHLAGALGKPVWVLLPFAPDWRWQLRRDDSPWYPSVRLFRQTSPGDWDDVFMRVLTELVKWARK